MGILLKRRPWAQVSGLGVGFRILEFRGLCCRVLGFQGLGVLELGVGFRILEFRGLCCRVLGFQGLGVLELGVGLGF